MKRPSGIRVGRPNGVLERLDDYSEALALAEAGEQLLAGNIIRRTGSGRKRILVLGTGATFSARLGEYAVNLALRLGYGLVFVSVAEASASPDTTAPMTIHMEETFARKSAEAARPWLLLAVGKGVEAGHMACFGDPAKEVQAVCDALHRIELILSDPEEAARLQGQAPSTVFTVA